MHEIQPLEGMVLLDAPEHMYPALLARVTLDGSAPIDDSELLCVGRDTQGVPRHDPDHGEQRASGLPALGATAGMVVRDVALDADFDFVLGTVAV